MGERFEYDNPRLISIVTRLTESFKRFGKPENVMVFAFPWIAKLYPKFMERDKTLRNRKSFYSFRTLTSSKESFSSIFLCTSYLLSTSTRYLSRIQTFILIHAEHVSI